jgi:uncharacterized protein
VAWGIARSRTKEKEFYLGPNHVLSPSQSPAHHEYVSTADIMLGTSMLETSSFGDEENDDLPGDQSEDDARSIYFETYPLAQDFDCFGYPTVRLNLECDKSIASIAVRLCEASPKSGRSSLVTFTFFNLCYRDGDMENPKEVAPGVFTVSIPLNIIGHVFKKGWKVRLSISPSYFPAMWQSPEIATVKVHVGPIGKLPASAVILPERDPRFGDAYIQKLLPSKTTYVNPEPYMPTLKTIREGVTTRTAEPVSVQGRKGVLVRKVIDSGAAIYGGLLDKLLVDQKAFESYRIIEGDPLSMTGSMRYESTLQRDDWKASSVTETRLWSEKTESGQAMFFYEARIQASINDEPFEEKRVNGHITRKWV